MIDKINGNVSIPIPTHHHCLHLDGCRAHVVTQFLHHIPHCHVHVSNALNLQPDSKIRVHIQAHIDFDIGHADKQNGVTTNGDTIPLHFQHEHHVGYIKMHQDMAPIED